MPVSRARLDELIAESEQRVSEQAYCVMAMELDGEDATTARRTLKGCARRLLAEAQRSRHGVKTRK